MYKRIRVIWDRNVIDVKFDTMQAPDEAPGLSTKGGISISRANSGNYGACCISDPADVALIKCCCNEYFG